jgi:glycosyltransferase involved in cell wall biosynthesis
LESLLSSMRIILIHNSYHSLGGEDVVVRQEANMLRNNGNEVEEYWRSNREVKGIMGFLKAPFQAVWARGTMRDLEALIQNFKPEIIHFHNTWLVISPAPYWTAKKYGIPVVQTLHNYRLLCPNAQLMKSGRPCEMCKKKVFPYPGILFGCYRSSCLQSLLVGGTVSFHSLLGTWAKKVDLYIALTEFARSKFIEGGIPAENIVLKPNFVYPDPAPKDSGGSYALFVGRLSAAKGLLTLIGAWKNLPDIPLKIVGDGLLMDEIRSSVEKEGLKRIEILGQRSQEDVLSLMKGACFLVFPSEWYEGFPVTICEAFACGVPVIVSRLGAMAEIVGDGRTGLHFDPGNPKDLTAKVEWAWIHEKEMEEMGREARREYEEKYTAKKNYEILMDIYETAIERARQKS